MEFWSLRKVPHSIQGYYCTVGPTASIPASAGTVGHQVSSCLWVEVPFYEAPIF